MDTNEFYGRKEELLERIRKALVHAHEEMHLLKTHEQSAPAPDAIALEELEDLMDGIRDANDWSFIEWQSIQPMNKK
jgi:hypothetical protein